MEPRMRNIDSYLYLREPSAPSNQVISVHSGGEHGQSRDTTSSDAPVDTITSSLTSESLDLKRHSEETLCLDGVVLDQPLGEHLTVNDFDLAKAFHNMEVSLKANKRKLPLEKSLLSALSSTSLLLLEGCDYPDEMKQFYNHYQWPSKILQFAREHERVRSRDEMFAHFTSMASCTAATYTSHLRLLPSTPFLIALIFYLSASPLALG